MIPSATNRRHKAGGDLTGDADAERMINQETIRRVAKVARDVLAGAPVDEASMSAAVQAGIQAVNAMWRATGATGEVISKDQFIAAMVAEFKAPFQHIYDELDRLDAEKERVAGEFHRMMTEGSKLALIKLLEERRELSRQTDQLWAELQSNEAWVEQGALVDRIMPRDGGKKGHR